MFKKYDLNFAEVLELLKNGYKLKVPEWRGYWALEGGKIIAHCENGDIVEATHFQTNVFRSDWMVFEEVNQ